MAADRTDGLSGRRSDFRAEEKERDGGEMNPLLPLVLLGTWLLANSGKWIVLESHFNIFLFSFFYVLKSESDGLGAAELFKLSHFFYLFHILTFWPSQVNNNCSLSALGSHLLLQTLNTEGVSCSLGR